jgi:tetratricopeptide (TPR) repeat protein/CHAT domain-containing protein
MLLVLIVLACGTGRAAAPPVLLPAERDALLKKVAALEQRAGLCELAGPFSDALTHRQTALGLRERLHGLAHWRMIDARAALHFDRQAARLDRAGQDELRAALRREQQALRLERQGKLAQAEKELAEVLVVYRRLLGARQAPVARALHLLGRVQLPQRKYQLAHRSATQALAIRREVLGENHPDTAASLNNRGNAQENLGASTEALADHQAALTIFRATLPADHLHIASSLVNRGRVQRALRQFREALASFEEGLAIHRKALPKGNYLIAVSLSERAKVLNNLGQYEAARDSHREALAIFRVTLPRDHHHLAASLNNLGIVEHNLRLLDAASAAFEEALAINRRILAADHPTIAETLSNLGQVQRDLGRYEAARRSHQEALSIFRKVSPRRPFALAHGLSNLGVAQSRLGQHEEARKSFEEELAIRRDILPRGHPDIARCLCNLGQVQRDLGRHDEARKTLQEALAARRQALPEKHPDIARILTALAVLQRQLGQQEAARTNYEKALAIQRAVLPAGHPDLAVTLTGLGNLEHDLGRFEAARTHHEEALRVYRAARPRGHPDVATSLLCLGLAQRDLGQYEAARQSLQEALKIRRQALPARHPDIAASLVGLGTVHRQRAEHEAARRCYEEALAIQRQALPGDHPDLAASLTNLGLLAVLTGKDTRQGRDRLEEALAIHQRTLPRLALAQAEQDQLLTRNRARLALDLLLTLASRHPEQAERACSRVVAFKGAVTARQRWARQTRDAAGPETRRLFDQLRQLNHQLLRLALSDPFRQDVDPAHLRALGQERARLEQALATNSPAYRRLLQQASRGAGDVRAALPEGVALLDLVEYLHVSAAPAGKTTVRGEPRFLAFVVRPGQAEVVLVPLGKSDRIASLVDAWRASRGAGEPLVKDRPDPAVLLRQEVWQKLQKHLGGATTVLYSPDGPLCRLPLAALPGAKPGTFLVHEHAFAVVPVPQLLPELLAQRSLPPGAKPSLLLLGGVDFGTGHRPGVEKASSRLPALPRFELLRGTESEVNDLGTQFKDAFADAPAPVLLRKDRARKAAFVKAAAKVRYLHLATHGFFATESEAAPLDSAWRSSLLRGVRLRPDVTGRHPGLLSGLVFAGANNPTVRPEDCVLTALEAAELPLERAELVTLSACETGLGRTAGGEGVLGLQRAFQLAGARSVLASLWMVRDEDTHRLMREFYRRVWSSRPVARAEALRQAQLWLIDHHARRGGLERKEKKAGPLSPHFWAGFVLSGDWR